MKTPKTYLNGLRGGGFFPYAEHRRRQYGLKSRIGGENDWKRSVYGSMQPVTHWDLNTSVVPNQVRDDDDEFDDGNHPNPGGYGGIFNLEFSPDGRLLAAACQNKAVLLFDPLTHALTTAIPAAHTDCVNGIKFLDERLFASCSDDHTVALWDIRNLSERVHSLRGHTKWVKNIEYHARDSLVVTSGFDGDVIAWDINRPHNSSTSGSTVHHERLFKLAGLMRMKVSPDLSKLLLCTSSGYMLLVQNLDLQHFQQDMKAFKQMNRSASDDERAVVGRRRNRPVLIKDFPATNKAEIIHSMQVHPQSWAVLSRNTSVHDESEWTCVHDIQEFPPEDPPSGGEEEDETSAEEEGQPKVGEQRRGTLPSGPPEAMDDGEEPVVAPSRGGGYYIMGDAATPRFEMMLDNRGGNWMDVAAAQVGEDEEEEEEEEDDEQDGFVGGGRRRGAASGGGDDDQLGLDDLSGVENNRQRAIMLGLNILIQRSQTNVFSDLRALGLDGGGASITPPRAEADGGTGEGASDDTEEARERRRWGRGRAFGSAPLSASPRDRIERQRLLHRYRWRVNRRPSLLMQAYRDVMRQRSGATSNIVSAHIAAAAAYRRRTNDNNNNNNDVDEDEDRGVTDRERSLSVLRDFERRHDERMLSERNSSTERNPTDERLLNDRNNEIRRTLRSLRSGLDLVMANLNSVRRQIDNDVSRGLNLNQDVPGAHRRPDHEPPYMSHRRQPYTSHFRVSPTFHTNYLSSDLVLKRTYAQQRPRLTHYILEPNVGRGFIKELCFSADGRLICSPYKYGVRLLSFNRQCSEMSHCVGSEKPQLLTEILNIANCHNKTVVSTKFSPTHTLLVSGCLDGKITWHQPRL